MEVEPTPVMCLVLDKIWIARLKASLPPYAIGACREQNWAMLLVQKTGCFAHDEMTHIKLARNVAGEALVVMECGRALHPMPVPGLFSLRNDDPAAFAACADDRS